MRNGTKSRDVVGEDTEEKVVDYSKLTDFELELRYWIWQALCNYENNGAEPDNMSDSADIYLLKAAEKLLSIARKQFEKELPKWKKNGNSFGGNGYRDIYLIRTDSGCYFTSSVLSPNDEYIVLDELEKLPKA